MHRLRAWHKRELRSLGNVQRRSDCDYKERRDGKVNGSCWTKKIVAQKFHRALPQLTLPCKSSARRTRQPSEDRQNNTSTLGNERHLGARTDPDIDTAGHHRLRHLAAAGEVDDRQVESVFLEDAELVADVDRNDRVRVRRGLADRERCTSGRRPPSDDRSDGDCQCGKQPSATQNPDHGSSSSLVRRSCRNCLDWSDVSSAMSLASGPLPRSILCAKG